MIILLTSFAMPTPELKEQPVPLPPEHECVGLQHSIKWSLQPTAARALRLLEGLKPSFSMPCNNNFRIPFWHRRLAPSLPKRIMLPILIGLWTCQLLWGEAAIRLVEVVPQMWIPKWRMS